MLTLKRVYEPADPEDGLRVLVERRWPWKLDKASAAIDRWEKEVAPSTELHRWFGGRPARWAEFRRRYALELGQQREKLVCLQAEAAKRPVTLLFLCSRPGPQRRGGAPRGLVRPGTGRRCNENEPCRAAGLFEQPPRQQSLHNQRGKGDPPKDRDADARYSAR